MEKQEFKQMIRLVNTDILGEKPVNQALTKIHGVGFMFSNAICNTLQIPKNQQIGSLTNEQLKKIEDLINNPQKYNLPSWLLNRRSDPETNQDKHLASSNLKLQLDFDIKRLKRIKSYRGMRHAWGLPVRGQRTRSNFRKGVTVGVKKKAIKAMEAKTKQKETKVKQKETKEKK